MRKIEKEMLNAVRGRYNWSPGNTEVKVYYGVVDVFLHDNLIYTTSNGCGTWFTLAGWNTQTTRSRLRALGVALVQKGGTTYYKGEAINKDLNYSV